MKRMFKIKMYKKYILVMRKGGGVTGTGAGGLLLSAEGLVAFLNMLNKNASLFLSTVRSFAPRSDQQNDVSKPIICGFKG